MRKVCVGMILLVSSACAAASVWAASGGRAVGAVCYLVIASSALLALARVRATQRSRRPAPPTADVSAGSAVNR